MPPMPVIPNTCRVAIRWASGGQHAVNVLHIRLLAEQAVPEVADTVVAAAVKNMWMTATDSCQCQGIDVTPLDGAGATYTRNLTSDEAFVWRGSGAEHFSPQVAAVVSLQTAKRGASYRGRVFIPMTAESEQYSGGLNPATVEAMDLAWATFQAELTNNGPACELVVASYKLATAESVIRINPQPILGTIRRRQSRLRQ